MKVNYLSIIPEIFVHTVVYRENLGNYLNFKIGGKCRCECSGTEAIGQTTILMQHVLRQLLDVCELKPSHHPCIPIGGPSSFAVQVLVQNSRLCSSASYSPFLGSAGIIIACG